jgi:hypothetical protein
LHLDLFEQPGKKRVFQHPVKPHGPVVGSPLIGLIERQTLRRLAGTLSYEREILFRVTEADVRDSAADANIDVA